MAKPRFKKVDGQQLQKSEQNSINVMKILADPYPMEGEDYAIHLWYKAHKHNPHFVVSEKTFNKEDNETATLVVNGERWQINIRKCIFTKI